MPRKPYRKTYFVKAGKGYLYKRAVPLDVQKVVGRDTWTKSLGRLSESAAEIAARACAADHDKLVAYLRSLPDTERISLISNGGYEGLRRTAEVDQWHATQMRRIADSLDTVPESAYEGAAAQD
jgi:hypothetical protein